METNTYHRTGFLRNFSWKSFSIWFLFLFITAILNHILFSYLDDNSLEKIIEQDESII
jgi:hypothetical protein